MKTIILLVTALLSFENICSQNDTMVFNYSDNNDTIYFRTYYSELIIRQDSTYTYTYFHQGYDNFENGRYGIRGKELKLYPQNSETGRTFLITSVKEVGELIYKSKSNSFFGYNFHLMGIELNLDLTYAHIGVNPQNGNNTWYYWFKSNGEDKIFIRWFTAKEEKEYAKKMKIVLKNFK